MAEEAKGGSKMSKRYEAGYLFEPGTKKEDPWYIKIQRLNSKIFITVVIISVAAVLIQPLNIPVFVEPFVLEVATWIESLEPGDVIWLSQHYSVGSITDYGAIYTSLILHIQLKSGALKALGRDVNGDGIPDGLKLIMIPMSVDGQIQFLWQIDRTKAYWPDNIVYGEDWVLWPYQVLSDFIYQKFSDEGFATVYTKDYYTSKGWNDLPVTKFVKSPMDIDCNIGQDATTTARIWAKYGKDPIDHSPDKYTKYSQSGRRRPHAAAYPVQVWDSAAQAVAMPYYTAGLYAGFFNGVRNGGEYEMWLNEHYYVKNDPKLGKVPVNTGFGLNTLDAMNLAQTWTFTMMIIGNIGYYYQRRKGRTT
ncbi:MAG: hypothetical protein QXF26_01015 [Candidatus Bathyarchaeia archaeon]